MKWWLLAIPHYLIVGVLFGGTLGGLDDDAGDGASRGRRPLSDSWSSWPP